MANNLLDPLSFPLYGSRLIEASAGTGKTYTIAALYLRLVLQHGKENAFRMPLLPPNILVLTFTKAATAELKDRIRARLSEAANFFAGHQSSDDAFLIALKEEIAAEDHANAAMILGLAEQWMDEAQVLTIHAWCYRMVREHAFASRSLFDIELLTQIEPLLQQVVEDYWRQFFYAYHSDVLSALGLPASPNILQKEISQLLNNPSLITEFQGRAIKEHLPLPDNETVLALLAKQAAEKTALLQSLRKDWLAIKDNFYLMAANFNNQTFSKIKTDETRDAFIDALYAWCHENAPMPDYLTDFIRRLFAEKAFKAGKHCEPHVAFTQIETFLAQTEKALLTPKDLWLHAKQWIIETFDERLSQQSALGFDQVLQRLALLLQSAEGQHLAEQIKAQYPVAMIDEFQDTDPVQYAIFDALYQVEKNHQDSGIFFIGDPKQAIYSFRGADIFTYLKARRATQGRHYNLATNYRSSTAMVAAVNTLFLQAESYPKAAFAYQEAGENPLPFHAVSAAGKQNQWTVAGKAEKALQFWWLDTPEEDKSVSSKSYVQQMAEHCASEIVHLLSQENTGFQGETFTRLQSSDIAILVRTANEAKAMQNALAARALPCVYLSEKESIFSQTQAEEVLFLLSAVVSPQDETAIRRVLAGTSLQFSYQQIANFDEDEHYHEAIISIFYQLREIWRKQGVLAMVHRFMQQFQVAEKLAQQPTGERAITNWLHLAEWLQAQAQQAESEQALLRLLTLQMQQGEAQEEHILRLESDAKLIKIVTIHKAKGLQYKVVFLPFIASFRRVNKNSAYIYQHDNQRVIELDGDFTPAQTAQRKEQMDEAIRLLYVALTRAEYACYLGLACIAGQAGHRNFLHESAIGYLLNAGEFAEQGAYKEKLNAYQQHCTDIVLADLPIISDALYENTDEQTFVAVDSYPAHQRARWWIASYSALQFGKMQFNETPSEENILEGLAQTLEQSRALNKQSLHDFPRGTRVGLFLHELLELCAKRGFHLSVDRAWLEKRCELAGFAAWSEVIHQWLERFLEISWHCVADSFSLRELRSYQSEMEFWLSVNHYSVSELDALISAAVLPNTARPALYQKQLNGLLHGFIDLVFEHQGKYYIADYKSNYLGANDAAYSQATMEQSIVEHRYDVQFVFYSLALHRLLKARIKDYCYEKHFGGVLYFYLRGLTSATQGVYFTRLPETLITTLDAAFVTKEKSLD